MQPDTQTRQEVMCAAHQAAADLIAVLPALQPPVHMALIVFLIGVADALDEGVSRKQRRIMRDAVMNVLDTVPGLVEPV